jgi:redox-sensitive bicupin YhaK (pirin superfamily)
MSNSIYFPADTREFRDLGFIRLFASFRPYLPSDRQQFGALITIDDAVVAAGSKGFGLHPHQNVEIVTFIHKGSGQHIDPISPSYSGVLNAVAVQAITAGTGIVHNEVNESETD